MNGALLLDYGRTLVDTNDVTTIFDKTLRSLGYHDIDRTRLVGAAGASRTHWKANYASLRRGERWTERIRIDCNAQVLRALGLEGDIDDISARVTRAWADHQDLRLFDDVLPALTELRSKEVRMGVVSQNLSSSDDLRAELRGLGIADSFSVVLTSEDCGYDKPDARLFLRAAGLIGAPPGSLLHVGDDYERDVLGARSAGITPVLIDRGGRQPEKECLRIRSMTELARLF